MRRTIVGYAAVMAMIMTGIASGAALDQKVVSANAKWLIHADLDSLKSGTLGAALFKYLQTGPLSKMKGEVKSNLGVDLDFEKVTAVTAYGTDFDAGEQNDGVVLVRCGQDLKGALNSLSEKPTEEVKITKTEEAGLDLYAVNGEMFVTQLPGNLLVASRTSGNIVKANEVLSGKSPNLSGQDRFTGYAQPMNAILLIRAEGFQQKEGIAGPLEVLKQTDGMQLSLAELADKVQLELSLKTPNKAASDQVSQMINGMLGLFKLNQENPDLTQLLNSAQVNSAERLVSISVSFPTEQALKKLAEQQAAQSQ